MNKKFSLILLSSLISTGAMAGAPNWVKNTGSWDSMNEMCGKLKSTKCEKLECDDLLDKDKFNSVVKDMKSCFSDSWKFNEKMDKKEEKELIAQTKADEKAKKKAEKEAAKKAKANPLGLEFKGPMDKQTFDDKDIERDMNNVTGITGVGGLNNFDLKSGLSLGGKAVTTPATGSGNTPANNDDLS